MMMRSLLRPVPLALSLLLPLALGSSLAAQARTTASRFPTLPLAAVDELVVPPVDALAARAEDRERERLGLAPRFAIPMPIELDPFTRGTFETLPGELLLWRLRVTAPGARNVNLGFSRYHMPAGGQLLVYSPTSGRAIRPFTSADNEEHGELWTPVVPGDELVLELTLPDAGLEDLRLELAQVGSGYRGFGDPEPFGVQESGACNVDVVCPIGDPWRNEIPAIGVISTGGSTFCTGFMVNNTANDRKPYFMTANHCGIGAGNAASLVVYWNYETSVCGGTPDGQLNEFNTGSFFRASYGASDFTLVELDDDPDPDWGVTFAGWDRSGVDEPGAVAIHHPATDEKRISFEYDPTTTTSYLGSAQPGNGTHVRVADWDVGTTEGGSSGSPLFNLDHQVIGQLHGGYAACSNDDADWYGKLSVSWTGGGTASTRLSNWLDPLGTGAVEWNTLGGGMSVAPGGQVLSEGPVGGPFTNAATVYTLSNNTSDPLDYSVSIGSGKRLRIDGGTTPVTGTIAAGGSAQVTVTLKGSATNLKAGPYTAGVIVFRDLTNGINTARTHLLEIGRTVAFDFPMDVDPGWAKQGEWAFGTPGGGVGGYGLPDPTSGATGSTVLGYAMTGNGTYANNLPERHLTTGALDCSGLVGTKVSFMRWLNVEQPLYDHARFRISTNGADFVTLWENGSEVTDSSWQLQEFDISGVADGQATVYLRWTMGSTDGSWDYTGWNVDDVQISGFPPSGGGFSDPPGLQIRD